MVVLGLVRSASCGALALLSGFIALEAADSSLVVYSQSRQVFHGFGGFAGKGVGWNINYSQSGNVANQNTVAELHDRLYQDIELRYLRLNLDYRFFETSDSARSQKPAYDDDALNALTSQVDMAVWAKQRNPNLAIAYSVWRPPHFWRHSDQGLVDENSDGSHDGFHWWYPGATAPVSLNDYWTDRTLTNNRLSDDTAKRTGFANYLVAFCQRFKALTGLKQGNAGFYPEYLCIQNEPDIDPTTGVSYDGCTYTPEQYAAVAVQVRAAFDAAGVTTVLFGPEMSYPSATNDANPVNNVFANYYKRFMTAAGSAVPIGAVHSYEFNTIDANWDNNGDGFDYRAKEMWHTEFSFSSKGNVDFHPNNSRTSSLYGKMVAARIRKLFASTFWFYSLALPANDGRLDEAVVLHNGDAGNNVRMTGLTLTKTYYVLKQMANALTPGSVVKNMAFNWNSGGEYDAGAQNVGGTLYPDAVALVRPDGGHVIMIANPRPTLAITGANLAISIDGAAVGTKQWAVRITDDTRNDAAIGTWTFTNGVAATADILIPARSVVTLVETTASVPPTITTQPLAASVTVGQNATFSVVASGTSPTYQWRRNGADIGGATAASYTLNAAQLADSGAGFSVAVTAAGTTVVSGNASLIVSAGSNLVPTITTQPLAHAKARGLQTSFSVVVASGDAPLAYVWRKNGTPLTNGGRVSGATTATLILDALVDGDAGTYSVIVTDANGDSVTSADATLTIVAPGAGGLTYRLYDDSAAAPGSYFTTQVDTGVHGTADLFATGVYDTSGLTDKFSIRWTGAVEAPVTGTYTVRLRFDDFCAAWFDGVQICNKFDFSATDVDLSQGGFPTYEKLYTVDLVAGRRYNLRLDFVEVGNNAIFQLMWTPPGGASVVIPSTALYHQFVPPRITTQPIGGSIAQGGNRTLTVEAAGDTGYSYQWALGGVAIAGATGPSYAITNATSADSGAYTVAITGTQSGQVLISADAVVTVATPPAITSQPVLTLTIAEGANATFTVVASGTGLTYQWRRDGADVLGAVAATYVLTAADMAADGAVFSVVVSGSGGIPVVSTGTTLTVVPAAPVITVQPSPLQVTVGSTATFTVTASGSNLSYQWQRNGTAISGATAASYVLTNAQLSDHGAQFSVVVSRFGVSVTSTVIGLTVTANPAVNAAPIGVLSGPTRLLSGQAGDFSVAITDDGLPTGSVVTSTWTAVGGAMTGSGANRRVTFSAPGTYQIVVQLSDGLLSSTVSFAVQVVAADINLLTREENGGGCGLGGFTALVLALGGLLSMRVRR